MPGIERTIVTSHADIRVSETSGPGLPLLMLHGSGASRRAFEPQLESLGERHHLIALDLPGHGESSDARDPAWCYTLSGLAETVADVLSALHVERVAVFGWSLGGHVAIELTHRHPGVAGLMLTGAPPVGRGPIAMLRGFHASWDMLLASKEVFSPRDVERFAHLCYGDAVTPALLDDIRRTDGRARVHFSRSIMKGDGADQKLTVETAHFPVAIVNGEHDPFIRHQYIAGLNIPTLWDGKVHEIPGTGHAVFRDAPERFNALLMRFAADAEAWRELREMDTARRA